MLLGAEFKEHNHDKIVGDYNNDNNNEDDDDDEEDDSIFFLHLGNLVPGAVHTAAGRCPGTSIQLILYLPNYTILFLIGRPFGHP